MRGERGTKLFGLGPAGGGGLMLLVVVVITLMIPHRPTTAATLDLGDDG